MTLDWRRAVVFTHRWLGIVLGLAFAAWFASGIVMMYARMPRLAPAERLAHLEALDLSAARRSPRDVVEQQHLASVRAIRVAMLLGRPVYRLLTADGWLSFFAENGATVDPIGPQEAVEQARRFDLPHGATVRYDGRLLAPDQWTLEMRSLLPVHRIAIGDSDDTYVYVSERSGDVVLRTTARERRAAYAGAVLHWLYFTPFRRRTGAWTQAIIWMSLAGCVTCLFGLFWGIYVGLPSSYRGWMWWHHLGGLLFGAVTFTWVFSGLLSMDPWEWHPSTQPTAAQADAFSGGALDLEEVTLDRLRQAIARTAPSEVEGPQPRAPAVGVREVEILPFRGGVRLIVDGHADGLIDAAVLLTAARDAMPQARVVDTAWLDDYDAYYYDRARELPLPVMRVRYSDPQQTWLYVDAARGAIVRKEERLTRVNRWLYHGFHSLDFPFLYRRRPLWDIVVIALSLGGLASAVTAAAPAWRRLRRHLRSVSTRR